MCRCRGIISDVWRRLTLVDRCRCRGWLCCSWIISSSSRLVASSVLGLWLILWRCTLRCGKILRLNVRRWSRLRLNISIRILSCCWGILCRCCSNHLGRLWLCLTIIGILSCVVCRSRILLGLSCSWQGYLCGWRRILIRNSLMVAYLFLMANTCLNLFQFFVL